MRTIPLMALALFGFIQSDSCNGSSSDRQQRAATEQLAQESNAQVGMPGITQFTEKRLMRQLYELRDKNIVTYVYVPDFEGRLWHLCDAIGYGLPYGAQFSNPERYAYQGGTLPNPEPNALFMPPTAEATWVICSSKNGEFTPVYSEPRVIISPFRLKAYGEYQE